MLEGSVQLRKMRDGILFALGLPSKKTFNYIKIMSKENHFCNSLLRTKNQGWLLDRGNLFKHCLGCIKLISTVFSNRRVISGCTVVTS